MENVNEKLNKPDHLYMRNTKDHRDLKNNNNSLSKTSLSTNINSLSEKLV